MDTKRKLLWLKLIGRVLRWVWRLLAIISLYFLVMAILYHRPWEWFFWALGIGVFAKWLEKGACDNQVRVAFVAELMAKGFTREEASKQWVERYIGNGP